MNSRQQKGSRRFNDQSYIEEYHQLGRFPKIHDDIAALVSAKVKTAPAIDFGCNIGLLSVRLVKQIGLPSVVGIEPDPRDFARRVEHPSVSYYNMPVDRAHLDEIVKIIGAFGIKVVVARRVISEIGFNNFDFMPVLSGALAESGIEQIFLEGRVYSSKSVHPIPNSEKECKLLGERFTVADSYKNCRYLVRK